MKMIENIIYVLLIEYLFHEPLLLVAKPWRSM